jgi:hypothetical protein
MRGGCVVLGSRRRRVERGEGRIKNRGSRIEIAACRRNVWREKHTALGRQVGGAVFTPQKPSQQRCHSSRVGRRKSGDYGARTVSRTATTLSSFDAQARPLSTYKYLTRVSRHSLISVNYAALRQAATSSCSPANAISLAQRAETRPMQTVVNERSISSERRRKNANAK